MVPPATSGGPSLSMWQPTQSRPGDISSSLVLAPIQRVPDRHTSRPTDSVVPPQAALHPRHSASSARRMSREPEVIQTIGSLDVAEIAQLLLDRRCVGAV